MGRIFDLPVEYRATILPHPFLWFLLLQLQSSLKKGHLSSDPAPVNLILFVRPILWEDYLDSRPSFVGKPDEMDEILHLVSEGIHPIKPEHHLTRLVEGKRGVEHLDHVDPSQLLFLRELLPWGHLDRLGPAVGPDLMGVVLQARLKGLQPRAFFDLRQFPFPIDQFDPILEVLHQPGALDLPRVRLDVLLLQDPEHLPFHEAKPPRIRPGLKHLPEALVQDLLMGAEGVAQEARPRILQGRLVLFDLIPPNRLDYLASLDPPGKIIK